MGSIAGGLSLSGAWQAFAQTGIRVFHSPDELDRAYDYLSSVQAPRGASWRADWRQAGRSVLVIEAGGPLHSLRSRCRQTGLSFRVVRLIGVMRQFHNGI